MSEATGPRASPSILLHGLSPTSPHAPTGEHGAAGEDPAGSGEAPHGAGQAEAVPELPAEAALSGRRGAPPVLPVGTEGCRPHTPVTREGGAAQEGAGLDHLGGLSSSDSCWGTGVNKPSSCVCSSRPIPIGGRRRKTSIWGPSSEAQAWPSGS